MTDTPQSRSLVMIAVLLAGLALYSLAIMQMGAAIADWSVWAQTPIYLMLGVVWIWPARRLLRWAAAGRDDSADGTGTDHD